MKSVYYVGSSSGSKKNKPDEKWYAIKGHTRTPSQSE